MSDVAHPDDLGGIYRTLIDGLDYGVLVVDGEGTVWSANPKAELILGFAADRVCGTADAPWTFYDEMGCPVPAERLPCQRSLATGEEQLGVTLGVQREDETFAWVCFSARPTLHGDTPLAVLSFTDVTGQRAEQDRLRDLAERDSLTDLHNRRFFDSALEREQERCTAEDLPAVVLLVDLDGLKQVNDADGHAGGDAMLREAAFRLAGALRGIDVLCRYGGDEFAAILPATDAEQGARIAERVTGALAAEIDGRPTPRSSVGMAVVEPGDATPGDVVARADAALYLAKRRDDGWAAAGAAAAVRGRRATGSELLLEQLGADADQLSIERAAGLTRDLLAMDVAYVTRHDETHQIFQALVGDGESFGVGHATEIPLEGTYCHHVLAGRLPALMPELAHIPLARSMPITEAAGVGAFISVAIRNSRGELFGTLCAASHTPRHDLSERDVQFLHVIARLLGNQIELRSLLDERGQLQASAAGTRALIAAVEARDRYTAEHSTDVLALVSAVGREMGLEGAELAEAEQVALLHDLGKLCMPDTILRKPGPLTDEEREVMRTHPELGAQIVAGVPELAHLAPAILAEHERWDGQGYPHALCGTAIPQASRIAFVCDAFHAMTSDRPYRAAMDPAAALEEIARESGSQFCPRAVAALLVVQGARAAVAA